jgi:hypothetical protein
MKELHQFIKNRNKIHYTLHKAYKLGFADSNSFDRTKTLKIIKNMQKSISSSYINNKISYSEMFIDFMDIIPNLKNKKRLESLFENFTIQYLIRNSQMDDMFCDYLLEQINKKKIIFINLCIYHYNTERCEEHESVHGTSMIFIPEKDSYKLFYVNSHGLDMKDYNEFHIIKTKKRCKVLKYDNVIDFIFLDLFTKYFNKKYNKNIQYQKNKYYNYWGANFQGGDSHGICFVFPYLIYYNLCKYYTEKKALLNGTIVDKFKTLLLDGNINRLVHSCFADFMKDVDDLDNTMMIDDLVVKLDYHFIKKVSNCFVAYISQSCFLK